MPLTRLHVLSRDAGRSMTPRTRVRAGLASIVAVGTVIVGAAYGIPYLRADTCHALGVRYLQQHPVGGRGFDRVWVSAGADDVTVHVTGPFTAEVQYAVPADLHLVRYRQTCRTGLLSTRLDPRTRHVTL